VLTRDPFSGITVKVAELELKMEKNRQGYLVSESIRECTKCGSIFENRSKTVTLCGPCNSNRVKEQSPEVRMFRRAKARAIKSGIDFNLDKEDIKIPTHCPILGIPLNVHRGTSGGRDDSPALDRVDNSKGYVKGNILVVSHLANMMKSSANVEQLIKFSEWVREAYVNTARD
jgi:hypothetical protein